MNYSVENEYLKITVSDLGAELVSVVSKSSGCEFIWKGDGKYWSSHAPMMFPICCRLYGGYYTYEGLQYFMGCHGFARKTVYQSVETTDNSVSMTLTPNDAIRDMYPFEFKVTVTHELCGNSVRSSMVVCNTGDDKPMYFTCGGHPGFNVPLDSGSFEDWYIEFDEECEPKQIIFTDTCFKTGKDCAYPLENGKIIRLRHELFDNDAIFLSGTGRGVTLKSDISEKSVHIDYPDLRYFGIWHSPKSDAPFVCLEPMNGLPSLDGKVDELTLKGDMNKLMPGECHTMILNFTFKG